MYMISDVITMIIVENLLKLLIVIVTYFCNTVQLLTICKIKYLKAKSKLHLQLWYMINHSVAAKKIMSTSSNSERTCVKRPHHFYLVFK